MIIIGSSAVRTILNRRPRDIDIFSTKKEFLELVKNQEYKINDNGGSIVIDKQKYEFQFSDQWPSCLTIEQFSQEKINTHFGKIPIAIPEVCCLIKKSHLYRQINFYKHINDFHILWTWIKQNKQVSTWAELLDKNNYREVYQQRLEDTKNHFPDRTPSLAKTKEDFFNDYVEKYFVHDEMHQILAHKELPMYSYCQKEEVLCDKGLWLQLSYEDKISMVREEALVIALERKIIPRWAAKEEYINWYKDAFYYAVMRICTNLCRGWFREFAQMNYPTIINYDFESKFNYFFEKVKDGTIKRTSPVFV